MELTKRGFNRMDADTMGVPSYTAATRTFSMAVKSGESYFAFMAGGKWFKKTTTQSVVWPDTTGTYYFYFDTSGTLQYIAYASFTDELFLTVALCGMVYWDAVDSTEEHAVDEQHGIINMGGMSSAAHLNIHTSRGFSWHTGGEISGLADASDVYTSISASIHRDEDIADVRGTITSTPFAYREGANGEWKSTAADLRIGHIASGDTYCSWNEWTGTTWQLTESTYSTDYIIMMMVRMNISTNPYRKIIGQKTYSSRSAARDGLANELKAIHLAGFSSAEAEFQFAWIAKRNGDLEDDGNGNAYIDLRGVPVHAFN